MKNDLYGASSRDLVSLAIVIPAYKKVYLSRTLNSIYTQTSKKFKCYIFNDASSDNLEKIVEKFIGQFDIKYLRFENNLGNRDLAGHWNRCIDFVKEKWVWLFSDDDIMENNCVENLINCISKSKNSDTIYKFQTTIIDGEGICSRDNTLSPKYFDINYFISSRFFKNFNSYAVEYVFPKRIFDETNGYERFPLAWGSDIATVMKFGKIVGFSTVPGAKVYWRMSDQNISSFNTNKIIIKKKLIAKLLFLKYFKNNFSSEYKSIKFNLFKKNIFYPIRYTPNISLFVQLVFIKKLLIIFDYNSIYDKIKYYLMFSFMNFKFLLKKSFKTLIGK